MSTTDSEHPGDRRRPAPAPRPGGDAVTFQISVLGPVAIHDARGESIRLRQGRPRKLLLALLLRRGAPVSTGSLIDFLWRQQHPKNASNALQILVSYLRKTLQPIDGAVERVGDGYRLEVDHQRVDMFAFEAVSHRLENCDLPPSTALETATGALAMWRGSPLSEIADEDIAQGDIARLWELRLAAIGARCQALLDLGRHREAIPDLTRAVLEHPFRERLRGMLALALYRADRQVEALQVIAEARSRLRNELGLDPSPDLVALERSILLQDPRLQASEPLRTPGDLADRLTRGQRDPVVPRGARHGEPSWQVRG